jgi:hypothetical protein
MARILARGRGLVLFPPRAAGTARLKRDEVQQQDVTAGSMIPRQVLRRHSWSRLAIVGMITSFLICIALSIADGVVYDASVQAKPSRWLVMSRIWIVDLRFVFEQVIYAATILFIGARFFEQRTLISVGIDRQDIGKMSVMGPDDNNILWIGRKYASRVEADTAASALRSRLMQSSETSFGEYGW